jgi:hypothetical protein
MTGRAHAMRDLLVAKSTLDRFLNPRHLSALRISSARSNTNQAAQSKHLCRRPDGSADSMKNNHLDPFAPRGRDSSSSTRR